MSIILVGLDTDTSNDWSLYHTDRVDLVGHFKFTDTPNLHLLTGPYGGVTLYLMKVQHI